MTFPMGILLVVISSTGIGMLGLLQLWQHKVGVQLTLDGCAAELGLELRDTQRELERLNLLITTARTAQAPQAAIAAAALQEGLIQRWNLRRIAQLGRRQCPVPVRRVPEFLRPLPWKRPPPDPLGPGPLIWEGPEVRIHLARFGRKTHVSVRKQEGRWVASFRTGFD